MQSWNSQSGDANLEAFKPKVTTNPWITASGCIIYIHLYTVFTRQGAVFHFSQPNLTERPFCIHTAPLPLTALCYRSGSKIINNPGSLQASWTWQTFPPHFLPLPLQLVFHTSHRPLKPTLENHLRGPRLRWHAVILQVSPIRTPDLLECRWAPSPWIHRKQKRHTGLAELLGMCMRVCASVCVCVPLVYMFPCLCASSCWCMNVCGCSSPWQHRFHPLQKNQYFLPPVVVYFLHTTFSCCLRLNLDALVFLSA